MKESPVFTRKRAVFTVAAVAGVLLLLIALRWHSATKYELMTTEGREMFLADLGWQIDVQSESYKSVVLPEKLEGVMEEYNRMQKKQGYDLSKHLGEECDQFSYTLTNYPGTEGIVIVTLYLQGNKLIAADIHSTALDGFMHGLYMEKK